MKKNYLPILVIILTVIVIAVAGCFLIKEKQDPLKINTNTINANLPNENTNAPIGELLSPHLRLVTPIFGAEVSSPLMLSGSAAGWYFEASFPIRIEDDNGNILAVGHADALEDWMTNKFVPFTAELKFKTPTTPTGMLILKKDNPSGDPMRDEEVDVPIRFAGPLAAACRPSGCSGQVCSDKEVVTTCEYLAKYACYKNAKCERQSDGECGWTETTELKKCLAKNK